MSRNTPLLGTHLLAALLPASGQEAGPGALDADGGALRAPAAVVAAAAPEDEPVIDSLPVAVPLEEGEPVRLRRERLKQQALHEAAIRQAYEELDELGAGHSDRGRVERRIDALRAELDGMQQAYRDSFVPQHAPSQLISPRQLFLSPLFNIRGKQTPRQELVKFDLVSNGRESIVYRGPELRQQDGLVFMALVNLARDYPVGTAVSFEPGEMCKALYGYYDGKARSRLKDSTQRLMHATIEFADITVHLATRFRHPTRGRWSVVLDAEIVKLFARSAHVWLDLATWKKLPEGLCTWLYAFVRSQVSLGQHSLEELARLCGSGTMNLTSFHAMLCRALNVLVECGIVDDGWKIRNGVLHWRKPMRLATA